ncbi:MAG: proline--tRNA ligase [Eubacteriales bacterium]
MGSKEKEFVKELTDRKEDFPRWYTDVVMKTDLADYSEVKGCMVIKPYGYGMWELIQHEMDTRFKATGHKNAYFPLFIPESLLKKEQEHVEGFAPEVAWVTHGGDEKLAERICVRPTSETIICSMYSKWIQSYRDLPMLLNQWCNVVRWEKSTRPFLRTSEFLWQEGHTAHADAESCQEETLKMLNVYEEFARNVLAIPVIIGQKSEKEKFAGAVKTYTMEAMMQDGKALQMGTSHNLGQHFAKVFDVQFLDKDGVLKYVHQTSWGTSTRMIGGVIMVHGDDRGLKLPPKIAPIQVIVVPIAAHKEGVLDKAYEVLKALRDSGIRAEIDVREQSPGWKFNEWELKGVPIRVEIGPKDIANNSALVFRRDTFEKLSISLDNLDASIKKLLQDIHENMLKTALAAREEKTYTAKNFDEFKEGIIDKKGFVRALWCEDRECEDAIKEKTGATTRCMPFDQGEVNGVCVHCGKPAKKVTYFARAY